MNRSFWTAASSSGLVVNSLVGEGPAHRRVVGVGGGDRPGECDFTFDRSGYRVPAIIVSPWVEPGSVYNDEYRPTSLIATLRKTWGLGEAFTQRDASARTSDHVFSLTAPRDPTTWATVTAHPVPAWTTDLEVVGTGLSTLGKGMGPALIAKAREFFPLLGQQDS